MDLVLFDLDNTLLNGDSDFEWGRYACAKGLVEGDEYLLKNQQFFQQYQDGTLDPLAYLEYVLKPLAKHDMGKLLEIRKSFVAERLIPLVGKKSLELAGAHAKAGNLVVIITATNFFVAEFALSRFQADDLIAPRVEVVNGRFSGRLASPPCFGAAKVDCLKSWLARKRPTYEQSWFYSDSINDLPLLEWVDRAVAVNADEKLRRVASQRNWPSLDLRGGAPKLKNIQ